MREVTRESFAYIEGPVTLQWQEEGSRVGYIRTHVDENSMPGDTVYTLAVELYADKTYEFKLLKADSGGRGPSGEELKRFHRYMESLGCRRAEWSRYKNGKSRKGITLN